MGDDVHRINEHHIPFDYHSEKTQKKEIFLIQQPKSAYIYRLFMNIQIVYTDT